MRPSLRSRGRGTGEVVVGSQFHTTGAHMRGDALQSGGPASNPHAFLHCTWACTCACSCTCTSPVTVHSPATAPPPITLQLVGRRGPRAARTVEMTSELLWTAPSTCRYTAQARPTTYGDVQRRAFAAAVLLAARLFPYGIGSTLIPPTHTRPHLSGTRRCGHTSSNTRQAAAFLSHLASRVQEGKTRGASTRRQASCARCEIALQ